jgi:hypothetical protein
MVSDMDWYERQQKLAELDESIAQNKREIAERQQRRLIEEAMTGLPAVDFSQCKSVGTMTQPQFSAWCNAGKPELPADRAEREARELQRRVERQAAMPVPAAVPAPATELDMHELDMHELGIEIGDEIGRVEAQIKRDVDQQIAELRAELRVAIGTIRAELKVAGEVDALRHEIEALRAERGRALRIVP